jgi:hypothetical protein
MVLVIGIQKLESQTWIGYIYIASCKCMPNIEELGLSTGTRGAVHAGYGVPGERVLSTCQCPCAKPRSLRQPDHATRRNVGSSCLGLVPPVFPSYANKMSTPSFLRSVQVPG